METFSSGPIRVGWEFCSSEFCYASLAVHTVAHDLTQSGLDRPTNMMWIMKDAAAHLHCRLIDYFVCLHDHNNHK